MCKMRVKSQKAEKLKTFALLFYLKRNIIEWIGYHIGKVMDFILGYILKLTRNTKIRYSDNAKGNTTLLWGNIKSLRKIQ